MNINHVALWAHDIELLKDFYCRWFNASATPEYHNPVRGLTSYLLSFPDGGATLEIMNEPEISDIGSAGNYVDSAISPYHSAARRR